jgi:hypothetical protein
MQTSPKRPRPRQPRPTAFGVPSKSSTSRAPHLSPQSAQRNYEQYLMLARAEAQAGNSVGAENYYQHAEHYFRLMKAN